MASKVPHKVMFIDLETSSSDQDRCGLIQLAASIDYDDKEVDKIILYANLFQDDHCIDEAFEKNGIDKKQLKSFPSPLVTHDELITFLEKHIDRYNKKDKLTVVAFKQEFDNTVLRNFFLKCKDEWFGTWFWVPWIDAMAVAMCYLQKERHHMENFKLKTVATYLGVSVDDSQIHDADYDRWLCREVYYKSLGA